MKKKTSSCNCIQEWIDLVESGKVLACHEQHQLVAYVRSVFENEELTVDEARLEKYLSFQKYFPFDLFPWQKFVLALHTCVFRKDGLPRFSDLLILMGRGGGKNGYISFETFCLLTEANGIFQYHIDICANAEDQAKTSFDEITGILSNPDYARKFRHNFYWTNTVIRNLRTRSELKYRTSNPRTKDGGRQGMVVFDEVHGYQDWENINVFTTGLGKKPCPRILYATTDGDVRDGVLDELKERSRLILDGEIPDNGLLPFICKLDNEDEVHSEANWVKANPSLLYRLDLLEQVRKEYANYVLEPVKHAAFMTKRMNIPKGRADLEVAPWEVIVKTNRPVPDLTGKSCVLGVDYTKTTDFMSAVLLFRVDGIYYAIHHSWFCNRSKDKGRIKVPLGEMERRGLLTIVDDVEIHPRLLAEWIQQMRSNYNIVKIACDNYRYSILSRELETVGYSAKDKSIKLVRPSDIMYTQVKVDSALTGGKVVWGDDPLMRWFTNNTSLIPAPNNNFKYGKIAPKARKTDGFMAFVHAMCVEDEIPEEFQACDLPTLTF